MSVRRKLNKATGERKKKEKEAIENSFPIKDKRQTNKYSFD